MEKTEKEKQIEEKFIADVTAAVKEYIDGEEGYGDDTLLRINPADLSVELVDDEEQGEELAREQGYAADAEFYYAHVMDLVKMSLSNPGEWIVDNEAISGLANQFC